MRFGTFHLLGSPSMAPAVERFAETIDHIALADELGFDAVWVAEHHFSNYGYSANPLLLIARASADAPRVRFGQAVLVTPFWHPLRLAEDIAITDLLTGGRLEIGLGRGYQPVEFRGLDVDQDQSRPIFEEQFEVMRLAWTADDFTFDGKHFPVRSPITVLPRPLQQPHPPIWLAVQSQTSLDWAAEQGCDVILSGASTDWQQLPAWIERFKQRRRPAPDDPARGFPILGVVAEGGEPVTVVTHVALLNLINFEVSKALIAVADIIGELAASEVARSASRQAAIAWKGSFIRCPKRTGGTASCTARPNDASRRCGARRLSA